MTNIDKSRIIQFTLDVIQPMRCDEPALGELTWEVGGRELPVMSGIVLTGDWEERAGNYALAAAQMATAFGLSATHVVKYTQAVLDLL